MASNAEIVRSVTEALGRGDLLAVMGMVTKDVRWAVNAADREAAPWFGVYEGKRSLPDFFAELAKLTFTDFTLRAMVSDGDLVITWLHVAFTAPTGRSVDMEEVQIWQLSDGKVRQVDTLLDTAAVGAAFRVTPGWSLALVHDYLTQRGGAERVVLALANAYPDAPVLTSLYDPAGTFPDFTGHDVRTLPLDRIPGLRAHHRVAMPLLAPAFSRLHVDAEVAVCSSSGWAHGARVTGRKLVYCHTPARWLYQRDRYLSGAGPSARAAQWLLAPTLLRWDRRAAASAHRYVVNSKEVRRRVAECYGIDAEVVPPPVDIDPQAPSEPIEGMEPGFLLCVSRLLPYKNVEAVCASFAGVPDRRLVVVGAGPLADEVAATAPANVTVLGHVSDASLRWLYRESAGLVAASYEDFGLTPVEAAMFGRPTAALRFGGYLDTTVDGSTGVFFDEPRPEAIAAAVDRLCRADWDPEAIRAHARRFSTERFLERMAVLIEEERSQL